MSRQNSPKKGVVRILAAFIIFALGSLILISLARSVKINKARDRKEHRVKPPQQKGASLSPTAPPLPVAGEGPAVCITGVAVPREEATAANTGAIASGISAIKNELGITVIWQLFPERSTEADWRAYMDAARAQGVMVLAALTDANHTPSCSGTSCSLGPVEQFLRSVAANPSWYDGVLYGVLLIDEPYEDINAAQLRSMYSQAKAIAPQTPLVVGWSRQVWKFGSKPGYEVTDGMADIHLISALEVRRGKVDTATLKSNQETSRRIIRENDPDAVIVTSVPVFGSTNGNYQMPTVSQLREVLAILLSPNYEKLDGLVWQSWEGPNKNKVQNQDTLADPGHEDIRQIVRDTCQSL